MSNFKFQMSNGRNSIQLGIGNWKLEIGNLLGGQSLVETLVALTLALILLTVTTITVVTALSNAQSAKNRNQATKFAQQGMEVVRQIRDSSWSDFGALSGNYCMAESCTTLGSGNCGRNNACGTNVTGGFSREVTIEQDSNACRDISGGSAPNGTRAIVEVRWADSNCTGSSLCREVSIASCFANLFGDPNL